MRISFNKNIVKGPWGGGNQILCLLHDYLKDHRHEVFFDLNCNPDIVVIMDVKDASCSYSVSELEKYKLKSGCKVVHRVNDNGSHRASGVRNDQRMIDVNNLLADETIFISQWIKNYYTERGLIAKKFNIIENGVNRDLFFPAYKVRENVSPIKIITHHWSNNMAKGYDIYEKLSEFCFKNPHIATFTFMGNKPNGFLNNANTIPAKQYTEIPSYLRDHDIYVTATMFESGGCHIVEGMACGLIPVVRIGGGGTEDYSKKYSITYKSGEDLINVIQDIYNSYPKFLAMSNVVKQEYLYGHNDMNLLYYKVLTGENERVGKN